MILMRYGGNLYFSSLKRSPSSHIVSKAFSRSIRQPPVHWLLFRAWFKLEVSLLMA